MNSMQAKELGWPYLRLIRSMAQCYQAFERASAEFDKQLGLTSPQFDIIATLGNTPGMSCKQLGEKTLMTKGTLTGVLDRLQARGLIDRIGHEKDGRSVVVKLTTDGVAAFETLYPKKVVSLVRSLSALSDQEREAAIALFGKLEQLLANTHHVPDNTEISTESL